MDMKYRYVARDIFSGQILVIKANTPLLKKGQLICGYEIIKSLQKGEQDMKEFRIVFYMFGVVEGVGEWISAETTPLKKIVDFAETWADILQYEIEWRQYMKKHYVTFITPNGVFEVFRPDVEELLKGGSGMNCNKKLAEYLDSHGITQAFLCDKTGITKEKMSNILNDKRKLTGDELVIICKTLGLTLEYFND